MQALKITAYGSLPAPAKRAALQQRYEANLPAGRVQPRQTIFTVYLTLATGEAVTQRVEARDKLAAMVTARLAYKKCTVVGVR